MILGSTLASENGLDSTMSFMIFPLVLHHTHRGV
jgi:hypothetical protein